MKGKLKCQILQRQPLWHYQKSWCFHFCLSKRFVIQYERFHDKVKVSLRSVTLRKKKHDGGGNLIGGQQGYCWRATERSVPVFNSVLVTVDKSTTVLKKRLSDNRQ